ncbi:MAG: hypothetical protein OXH00_05300 [Candidatus Poribacteria bacterium]|nr:hypothetical protein [Candidatus Poribacteria bacterium]
MKKSFYSLLVVFSLIVSDTHANEGVSHLWNEFEYVGFQGGTYDIGDREDGLFAGLNGFYHTYLEHSRSGGVFKHFNSLGVLGTLNYYLETEDIALSGFITSGYYLSEDTLLQWGVGMTYSGSFGTSLSVITHVAYAYHADYALAFFAQTDYFPEIDAISAQFGVSFGFGSLKSYQ